MLTGHQNQAITTLPEFFKSVRQLKGLSMLSAAQGGKLNAANASRLERTTLRPTPDTLDHMSHPHAWGCPWQSPADNRTFLRRLAAEFTGQREYGETGLYFVRPLVPLVRQQWHTVSAAREVIELWPALKLPGWRPIPNQPAPAAVDPLWWWAADEGYQAGRDAVNRAQAEAWDARWLHAVSGESEEDKRFLTQLIVSRVVVGANQLASEWLPDKEESRGAPDEHDWWERYHDKVMKLNQEDQALIQSFINRLS